MISFDPEEDPPGSSQTCPKKSWKLEYFFFLACVVATRSLGGTADNKSDYHARDRESNYLRHVLASNRWRSVVARRPGYHCIMYITAITRQWTHEGLRLLVVARSPLLLLLLRVQVFGSTACVSYVERPRITLKI